MVWSEVIVLESTMLKLRIADSDDVDVESEEWFKKWFIEFMSGIIFVCRNLTGRRFCSVINDWGKNKGVAKIKWLALNSLAAWAIQLLRSHCSSNIKCEEWNGVLFIQYLVA